MALLKHKQKQGVLATQPPKPELDPFLETLATSKTSGGGGGGGARTQTVELPSDESVLNGYLTTLYGAYKPNPVSYEARGADELRLEVEGWLRPAYEQAIAARRRKTEGYRAELDADAISRGMGASTYVTDVKSRQMEAEAEDVALLEGEYGAALQKAVYEQLDKERERALEVETQNRQNDYDAYMKAYSAALSLFSAYKAKGGGVSYTGTGGGSSGKEIVPTTAANCELFLQLLTGEERAEVYLPTTEQGRRYRDELIASVGLPGYYLLMGKYPSTLG